MEPFFPNTPRKETYEWLKDSLIGRQELLQELTTSLRDQARAKTLQHWLILGPRGIGKSHTVTLMYHMAKIDESIRTSWIPLLMNEEEQVVFSLHSFLTRILEKLAQELSADDQAESRTILDLLDTLRNGHDTQEEILETVLSYLRDFEAHEKRRLLVLIENLDDLLSKSIPRPNDAKKLRNILQNETFLLLVATSPTSFERISDTTAPFYGFFRIRRLPLLDYSQSVRLMNKWADLEARLKGETNPGQRFADDDYRLMVLYHLTGGNPRLLMFLYVSIAGQDGVERAVRSFGKLLEGDLNNYYLGRMRDLSNQEQPIVIALAESRHNLTQSEIARRTFLPARSIGTAMVRLENDGIVRSVGEKRGKNTPYTLTDHLFRLWYQYRTSVRDRNLIETLVEFLAVWYKRKELRKLVDYGGVSAAYGLEALNFRRSEDFRSYLQPLRSELRNCVGERLERRDYRSIFDTLELFGECGLQADDLTETTIKGIEERGDLSKAEQQYRARVDKDPDDFSAQLLLGHLLAHKSDNAGAQQAFERTVALDPQNAEGWRNLAIARDKQKQYAGAEEAFARLTQLQPKSRAAWVNLGIARFKQDNYSGAENAYARAAELDPTNARVWIRLGDARVRQKDYTGAEQALSRAVTIDPRDVTAWCSLTTARVLGGNYAGSEEAAQRVLSLDEDHWSAWVNIGYARARLGNYAGAEEALLRSLELKPDVAGAWDCLGFVRWNLGNLVGADEALAHALTLDSSNIAAWINLGRVRTRLGNYAGAEEVLTQAITLDPQSVSGWTTLGVARAENKDYASAEEAFMRAVTLDPDSASAWLKLGAARREREDHVGAEEASMRAVTLDPNSASAWLMLGRARSGQKNHAGAEEALGRALALDSKNAAAWTSLGLVRLENGNYAGAREAFARAVTLDPDPKSLWLVIGWLHYKSYEFRAAADAVLRAIEMGEEDKNAYSLLCEISLKGDISVDLRSELDKALARPGAVGRLRGYIHFLRGLVLLHYADMTPCREDVQAGLEIADALPEDDRRALLADLIDLLIEMAADERSIHEIGRYIDTIRLAGTERVAGVLDPVGYVLEYAEQYSTRQRYPGKGKSETVAATQRILDNVPAELRGPVDEMVQKAKRNIEWWERRTASRSVSRSTQKRKPSSRSHRNTIPRGQTHLR